MKKTVVFLSILAISLSSCGTKKKLAELEAKNKECQDLLNTATVKLNLCLTEKDAMAQQIDILKKTNTDLISNVNNLTMLSSKGAENLEKSLESLKEKDLRITRLQDAMTRKDSVTFALMTSLKGAVGISDPDIQINVEKGVVMINIADKLLFKSGSYEISSRAQEILGKVAKVINERPEFECMVESHTDNVPYRNGLLLDNWDLSAKRATAVVRMLTKEHKVDPKQMIAAGRGEFVPLMANTNAENRAANRRTRIIVMPKIDQFYDMIEKEMKKQSGK
jgi:chemotaxis protein MotB